MKKYPLAEKFFAPQGEGLYTGTPMAFIRFVGCSVGKKVCIACDTAFENMDESKGGGLFSIEEILHWVDGYSHVCLTGGEPLDRNLEPLVLALQDKDIVCHIETSGTKHPDWLSNVLQREHLIWLCVSPKPGWLPLVVNSADEIKVIQQGLGDGKGWPTLDQALEWARTHLVYIQPKNGLIEVDLKNLQEAIEVVLGNPSLRLSVQMHKFLETR